MQQLKNFNLSIRGKYELEKYKSFVRGEKSRREAYPTLIEAAEELKSGIIALAVQSCVTGILLNELSKEGIA